MGAIIAILYGVVVIGVSIYVLVLMSRAVRAHERAAGALERIAHNMKPGGP